MNYSTHDQPCKATTNRQKRRLVFKRDCSSLPVTFLTILFSTFFLSSLRTIRAVPGLSPAFPLGRNIAKRTSSSLPLKLNSLCIRGGANRRGRMASTTTTTTNNNNNNTADMMHDDPDQVIGGGAINEKKRTFLLDLKKQSIQTDETAPLPATIFQGTRNQAHFLHAIEGLDRYPNYLARWNENDAEELELALQQRLDKVRQQRNYAQSQQERIKEVITKVCQEEPAWETFLRAPKSWDDLRQSGILEDGTSRAIFRSKFFRSSTNHTVPSLQEVLNGNARVDLDAGYLEEIMEEENADVYSFRLLSESFCGRLQAYVQRITVEIDKSSDPHFKEGGQRTVRNLDNLGLGWLNDLLFHLVVRPISRHLYQETEMGGDRENSNEMADLDWRHGFIAAYAADPDQHKPRQRLVPHTDDAEVTLNVCIGDVFEGGHLKFWGLRGTKNAGALMGEYVPQRGRALLHAGRQLHEVTEVTSGNRFALIMWTRSWNGIRSKTCPCCWLNRRSDGSPSTSCICSARWN